MDFTIGETRVAVSYWFLAGLALCVLLDKSFIVPVMIGVVALHECAHITALALFRVRIRSLCLLLYGVKLDCDLSPLPRGKQAAVFLCAPVLNLILGGAFFLWDPNSIFGALNLCIGAFNLLPVPPLDGGNALQALLTSSHSAVILRATAMVFLIPVLVCGMWLCVRHGNFTLLVCVGYLAAMALLQR